MQGFEKKEWSIALVAMLICVIAPFASDSYVPSLPTITKVFGSTVSRMQLTMSLYFLGAAFAQLIYGPLSDHYGRRGMVLTGLSICVAGSFLCVLSLSPGMLIAARFVQGVGAGACNGLFRAILRDSFEGAKLAQVGSYIGIIFPVTLALAPIVGGYVETLWGWRESFLVAGMVIAGATLMVWRYLPETNRQPDVTASRFSNICRNYTLLLTHPRFMGYTLLSSFTFAGFIYYYSRAPFLLQDVIGLTPVQFGWLSVFISLGVFISQYLNSQLVMKYGIRPMLYVGVLLMMLSGAVMLIFALFHVINTWVIIVPTVIFSLASGFVFANAMAGAFEHFGHMAGVAGAMYGFLQMGGSVLPGLLLTGWISRTQLPLALVFFSIGLMTFFIYYLLYKSIAFQKNELGLF